MNHILDIQGQLIVETSYPLAKINFQGANIFLSLQKDNLKPMTLNINPLNFKKMFLPVSEFLYKTGMTLTIQYDDETLLIVGKGASPSKFMSVFSGKHVQITNLNKCMKILKDISGN